MHFGLNYKNQTAATKYLKINPLKMKMITIWQNKIPCKLLNEMNLNFLVMIS